MRFFANIVAVVVLGLAGFTARAAHTEAQLVLSAEVAKPGDTVLAAVRLQMDPGWHTYWKNGGDAGSPTKIEWQLPPGITAGEIEWPLPEKLPPAEVTTYGYEGEAVLLVPLKVDAGFVPTAGPIEVKAKVSWLECQDACIPAGADVTAMLSIRPDSKASAEAALFPAWQAKTPEANSTFTFQAGWEKAAVDKKRPVIIEGYQTDTGVTMPIDKAEFFPEANDAFEVATATEKVPDAAGFALRKMVTIFSGDWPKSISGLMVIEGNGQRRGFNVTLPVGETVPATKITSAAAPASGSTSPAPAGKAPVSLGLMLLYAFIGGLILNIMPCVLPVIALKILGFVSEAKSSPGRVRALGGVYATGVLFSFLVLAGVVIGIKGAGHQAGWGMQFGNPIFVVCLTTLVTLVALNLFGVFEVTLGGGALDKAGELASKQGAAGAFFNGVLATVLATPCTAPFLGIALGFAFAQSPVYIVLIFMTAGLGLATPYVLLSWNPAWLKFLPKPGAWMEKFKIAIGFPILGTALWLFTLTSGILNKSQWLWFGLFLIALALAAWIWGEFVQRGTKHRGAAMVISLLLAGSFGVYAYRVLPDKIDWQAWSPEAVAKARAAGKIVLVDFTASWCVTCNATVKPALETDAVTTKLKALDVVTLLADYSRTPAAMTEEIAKYGAGVPLVLVYPPKAEAAPIVLPQPSPFQLAGSYGQVILDALERAAK